MSFRTHSGHIIQQAGVRSGAWAETVKAGRGNQVKGVMCARVPGESDPGEIPKCRGTEVRDMPKARGAESYNCSVF